MLAFRADSQVPGDQPWVACLLQLKAGGKLVCELEYDDVDRWAVRPASYEEDIERLRPSLT